MKENFNYLGLTRNLVTKIVKGHSIEALNKIPTGYNNNLIWNFGHLVVTQQLLCYKMSGLDCLVPQELIDKYRKGTQPTASIGKEELDQLFDLSATCLSKTAEDYENGVFQNYHPYQTSFGAHLQTIEDSIRFNNIHEGFHLGYMMALKKVI